MMRYLVLLLFFGTATLSAQSTVTVAVNNIEAAGKGSLTFCLFADKEGFPKDRSKATYRLEVTDFKDSATAVFEEVASGTYAVTVMQDRDGSGEIETNFIGMPKEPIGLSNYKKLGRPSFSKAKVEIAPGNQTIQLKLLNQ
ncbi:MAG: DUF2141 domain-containing protein [Bacteroidota bacterium]